MLHLLCCDFIRDLDFCRFLPYFALFIVDMS